MSAPHDSPTIRDFNHDSLGLEWGLMTPPVVLTIAGFDPSSGAGITADIKTMAAHDCYGIACITALTVQSTAGVRRVEPVAPRTITETLQELVSDLEVAAVHIGMLGSQGAVEAVAEFLAQAHLPHTVLDPILKSSSGASLLDVAGTGLLIEKLIPLAQVITPNLDEASALTGFPVTDIGQMKLAAAQLHSLGAANATAPAALSLPRWPATWPTGGVCRRRFCCPRHLSERPSPTRSPWGGEWDRWITCTACGGPGARVCLLRRKKRPLSGTDSVESRPRGWNYRRAGLSKQPAAKAATAPSSNSIRHTCTACQSSRVRVL